MRNPKLTNKKKGANPNAKCILKIFGKTEIKARITDENIEDYNRLIPAIKYGFYIQKDSNLKLKIGDYVTFDMVSEMQFFDKDLNPKSFSNQKFRYSLSEDQTQVLELELEPTQYHYRIIKTQEELAMAKMFDITSKINNVVVEDRQKIGWDILTMKAFRENYELCE
ncbi:hypothetical protein [Flavobacterium sp. J27]|uniref:hypothetical protein n=1 Tax=Flavobacterium sp. J27 TaxID=2060419 RepID=UPI001031D689|nr:hypothetical protein [Flavobacterium sp. J27]